MAQICSCDPVNTNLDLQITINSEGSELTVSPEPQHTQEKINWDNLPFQVEMGNIQMTRSEELRLLQLFQKFSKVFSQDQNDLGFTDTVEHRIRTTDDIPIKHADRRNPPQLESEIRKILEDWLRLGIIKESESPYASQIVPVRKKSGEIRLCVDFRHLNNKTIKDAYPIPRIDECIESLNGA